MKVKMSLRNITSKKLLTLILHYSGGKNVVGRYLNSRQTKTTSWPDATRGSSFFHQIQIKCVSNVITMEKYSLVHLKLLLDFLQMSLGGQSVAVVQLPGGQFQVQGVIQTAQSSVIQSPQVQSAQVRPVSCCWHL